MPSPSRVGGSWGFTSREETSVAAASVTPIGPMGVVVAGRRFGHQLPCPAKPLAAAEAPAGLLTLLANHLKVARSQNVN
jgi:hypothetical protein